MHLVAKNGSTLADPKYSPNWGSNNATRFIIIHMDLLRISKSELVVECFREKFEDLKEREK